MSLTDRNFVPGPEPYPESLSPAWVPMAERHAIPGADQSSYGRLVGCRVGRYTIRECLGVGGMGEVYRADDSVLKRSVAIKRIAPRVSGDPACRERLLREAERASSITNQHTAAMYDVLEDDRELYLVMEFVEGDTLRKRLRQALTIDEFFHVAEQCAEALTAAHERGILHCDLKPDNIMITPGGEVKILDFGLAKTLPHTNRTDELDPTTSKSSSVAGTPAYMSPEVLMEKVPDERSDIFSLGVVFYEALTGVNPFRGDSFVGTSMRIVRENPLPMRALNREVPESLERVVFKMIAKQPEQRYASAKEVLDDLIAVQRGGRGPTVQIRHRPYRWKLIAALLVLVAICMFALALWKGQSFRVGVAPTRHIAVLPFRVVDQDASTQAFGSGLTETLTAKLGSLSQRYGLMVVPAGEIHAQHIASAEQARQALGVNLIVEGSLQHAGEQIRVNYNLVDARTLRQLRAGTVTAEAKNTFSVEDQVVESVISALDLELGQAEKSAMASHGTTEPAAYDFYLRGRGYLQEYDKPENIDNAIEVFTNALGRDPQYALAFAGLGESYQHKYVITHDSNWLNKGMEACEKAVSLAPSSAEGYTCLGSIYNETGQYERATENSQHALRLDPNDDSAYLQLALAYENLQKFDDAERTYRKAISLRPQYVAPYNWLGAFLYGRGRYTEAAEAFRQATELAPDNFRSYDNLGGAYISAGLYDEAIRALKKSVEIRPSAAAYSNLGAVYFYLGDYADAAQAYEKAMVLDQHDPAALGNLAEAYYWIAGKRELAATTYRAAISMAESQLKVNPRDFSLMSQIGIYHAMLDHKIEAERWTKRALDMRREDPEVLLNASLVAAHFREDESAIEFLRKAIAAGLNPETARRSPAFQKFLSNPGFLSALKATTAN